MIPLRWTWNNYLLWGPLLVGRLDSDGKGGWWPVVGGAFIRGYKDGFLPQAKARDVAEDAARSMIVALISNKLSADDLLQIPLDGFYCDEVVI